MRIGYCDQNYETESSISVVVHSISVSRILSRHTKWT